MDKSFPVSVKKLLCVQASVCTSFSVQKLAVCKRFSASNLPCGKRKGRWLLRRDPFLEQVFQLESGDDLRVR